MVAFYFDPIFIDKIAGGSKRQALVERSGRRVPLRGSMVQLRYRKRGRDTLIAEAACLMHAPVVVDWTSLYMQLDDRERLTWRDKEGWQRFAQLEGFTDCEAMRSWYVKRAKVPAGISAHAYLDGFLLQWDRPRIKQ